MEEPKAPTREVEAGLNRLEERAKKEAIDPPVEVKPPPDSQPAPPPEMREVRLQLIPWDLEPEKGKNRENAIYFIRILNPNDNKWQAVACIDELNIARPMPVIGEKNMKDMIDQLKRNNPMLKVGWVKYKPKAEG